MQVDLPEIVAEVSAAFANYQKALDRNDVAALNGFFWNDMRAIRYGGGENLYGYDAIKAFRSVRAAPEPGHRTGTVVTAFGRDFAVVSTLFHRPNWQMRVGRLMQTWVRLDGRWQIAAAHVSVIDSATELKN